MNPLQYIRATFKLGRVKEATARDPKKIAISKIGQAVKSSGGGDFEDSPVDLAEVGRAYFTDSYIRRAVDKYASLMFKNGWELQGKNENATEYVWTRLKLMAEATKLSTEELLATIAKDYVLYGNAYVVKSRQKAKGGTTGINSVGYLSKQPVAGYFPLNPTAITVSRDDNGTILKYQEESSGGSGVEYNPEDVVHFAYGRPTSRAYGVPMIFNVMDDVKILRQIEENVARLIYRNLFPLYMYQVGSDKPGFEATDEEIEAVREEIRTMPMDGGLVVPERHNIKVIGAEGNAIDANGYLQYFRQRVFTGLGVSDTVMGIGGTANKSTADNQSSELNDGVKEFQRGFADIVRNGIINELLFEGGFDPVMNPDDEVDFMFAEIELDSKIKKENHYIQMFTQNAITHEEMRLGMGLDPVSDEARLYYNMVTGSLAQQAADNAMAQAQQSQQAANNAGDNKNRPENQHGKQQAPKTQAGGKKSTFSEKNVKKVLTEGVEVVTLTSELNIDSFRETLEDYWNQTQHDVLSRVKRSEDTKTIKSLTTRLMDSLMENRNRQYLERAVLTGFRNGREQAGIFNIAVKRKDLEDAVLRGRKSIAKVVEELEMALDKLDEVQDEKRIAYIERAFHANKYRLKLISKTMLYASYNYGVALAAKATNQEQVHISCTEAACATCSEKSGSLMLTDTWKEDIPPHHPGCNCEVMIFTHNEEGT